MCPRLGVVTEDRNAPGVENREIIFCFFNYDPPRRIFLILYLYSVTVQSAAGLWGGTSGGDANPGQVIYVDCRRDTVEKERKQ